MRADTCACGGCDGGAATQQILVAGIGNIFLGDETVKFGLLQKRDMGRAAQAILDDMGFQLPAQQRRSVDVADAAAALKAAKKNRKNG